MDQTQLEHPFQTSKVSIHNSVNFSSLLRRGETIQFIYGHRRSTSQSAYTCFFLPPEGVPGQQRAPLRSQQGGAAVIGVGGLQALHSRNLHIQSTRRLQKDRKRSDTSHISLQFFMFSALSSNSVVCFFFILVLCVCIHVRVCFFFSAFLVHCVWSAPFPHSILASQQRYTSTHQLEAEGQNVLGRCFLQLLQ